MFSHMLHIEICHASSLYQVMLTEGTRSIVLSAYIAFVQASGEVTCSGQIVLVVTPCGLSQ